MLGGDSRTGSSSTARPSTLAAAGSRPTTGCCSGAACRPASSGVRKGDEQYLIPDEADPVPPPGTAVQGRGGGRAAYRADAHPLRAARAVRSRVPRLRLAGHRREHGAVHRPGWTSTCPRSRPGSRRRSRPPATRRSRPGGGSTCGCCRGPRRSPSPTSSAPRPTSSRRTCPGRPHRRHRRAGPAGRRRHPRGLDQPDRPDRGRQDREQGQGLPPPADPDRD